MLRDNEYALVLAGGGARGSYQLGVWKALRELNIDIKAVTGTSIGALNGAMIAAGTYESAHDLWYNMEITSVIKGDNNLIDELQNIKAKSFNNRLKCLKNVMDSGGIDVSPLQDTLKNRIDEKKVRESNIDFGLVTVEVDKWKPLEVFIEDIPEGKLHEYLMASASLPVFKPEGEKRKFLDGCFHDNLPIQLITTRGYKKVIAVDLGAFGAKRNVKNPDVEITYIKPSEPLGQGLEFNRDLSRRNIKMGYYDTMKKMKNLKGKKYYFDFINSEDYVLNRLINLPKDIVLQIGYILGIEGIPPRRMLFEGIIPKIAELLGCTKDENYGSIIMSFYEAIAENIGLDRFKIYNYREFQNIVEEWTIKEEAINKGLRSTPKFLKHSNMYQKSVKDQLMQLILWEILVFERKYLCEAEIEQA